MNSVDGTALFNNHNTTSNNNAYHCRETSYVNMNQTQYFIPESIHVLQAMRRIDQSFITY